MLSVVPSALYLSAEIRVMLRMLFDFLTDDLHLSVEWLNP